MDKYSSFFIPLKWRLIWFSFAEKVCSSCLIVFRVCSVLKTSMDAFWLMIWGKSSVTTDTLTSLLYKNKKNSISSHWCFKSEVSIFRLGKTLQSITLLYTLLRQGFDGKPMVKKAIIVTPTSLVSNWEAEIKKWVGERVKLVALCESTREDVISGIDSFTRSPSPLQVLFWCF